MTYLNWGCEPLEDECESCIDAICTACQEDFKRNQKRRDPAGFEDLYREDAEPDCDDCDPEKKPDCSACEIVLEICRKCPDNKSCAFKICG